MKWFKIVIRDKVTKRCVGIYEMPAQKPLEALSHAEKIYGTIDLDKFYIKITEF